MPRPIFRVGARARIVIVGQAPGSKVHQSGVPWQDDSGDHLLEWLNVDRATFEDPGAFAILPMGFCFPVRRAGGDLPPRPECAPTWHERLLSEMPAIQLTLLVGQYAQARYSTMFIGKIRSGDVGRITCHTKSRFGGLSAFPDQWHLDDPSYLYTFIHISRDDSLPLGVGRSGLDGWWHTDDTGGRYYYLSPAGHANFGMQAPRSALERPGVAALNSGHYFVDGGTITRIWRLTGEVDVWQRNGDDAFVSQAGVGRRVTRWTERRHR